MLLAVLHRQGGLSVHQLDVFLNVVGGVKISETGSDLAVLFAVLSSFKNRALDPKLVVFGEVGLGGEIRPVQSGQERIKEAAKHGFTRAIIPKSNAPKSSSIPKGIEVIAVATLQEAISNLF
jgi:DNA repair protein RadA/Sms